MSFKLKSEFLDVLSLWLSDLKVQYLKYFHYLLDQIIIIHHSAFSLPLPLSASMTYFLQEYDQL